MIVHIVQLCFNGTENSKLEISVLKALKIGERYTIRLREDFERSSIYEKTFLPLRANLSWLKNRNSTCEIVWVFADKNIPVDVRKSLAAKKRLWLYFKIV